jgi:hypothetical protein
MDNNSKILYRPLEVDPSPLTVLALHRQLHEAVSVAFKLGLFKRLECAKTPEELAEELGADPIVMYYLLKLLQQIGCVAERGDKFGTTPLSDTYLVEDSYLNLGHEFKLASDRFDSQLIQALFPSAPEPSPEPNWSQERLRQLGVFGLMGSIQSSVQACDLGSARHLLDLGGGHGLYSIAFAQKYPGLKVTLFDLPRIVVLAEAFVQRFSVQNQVLLQGGDFLVDDIGSGYDAVLCSNVLHSSKRDVLLAKVRLAIKPGGQIIVRTRLNESPDNLENAATKLLWQVRGGRELFSFKDWQAFLAGHGFPDAKLVDLSGIYATIIAHSGGDDAERE